MSCTVITGDVRDVLADIPAESVQCVVTSPPYYGLRDYGVAGQMGLEATPAEFVAEMVRVFRGVRNALKADGVCWLNIGDSYASSWPCNRRSVIGNPSLENGKRENRPPRMGDGLKEKDLMMVPARLVDVTATVRPRGKKVKGVGAHPHIDEIRDAMEADRPISMDEAVATIKREAAKQIGWEMVA